jgi:hypothetical protein
MPAELGIPEMFIGMSQMSPVMLQMSRMSIDMSEMSVCSGVNAPTGREHNYRKGQRDNETQSRHRRSVIYVHENS